MKSENIFFLINIVNKMEFRLEIKFLLTFRPFAMIYEAKFIL